MKRYISSKIQKSKERIKLYRSNSRSWTDQKNIPEEGLEDEEEDSSDVRFAHSLHELQATNLDTDGLPVCFLSFFSVGCIDSQNIPQRK